MQLNRNALSRSRSPASGCGSRPTRCSTSNTSAPAVARNSSSSCSGAPRATEARRLPVFAQRQCLPDPDHMDPDLYSSLANRASDLVEAGEHQRAIDILEKLVESDLPDFDKAVMQLNIATVLDKMGDHEGALASYATALDFEGRTDGYFVAQQYAAYLAHLGRYADSIMVYQ